MKKLLILIFLYCIGAPALRAQDWSLSLSSNVEIRTWKLSTKADKEEKGLNNASIKLFKGSALINEVKSFPNGDFKIDIPGNGEFTLEVSYPGCNTKKFAISTLGVPPDIAKDNFRPSYGIGGFIMARPLPGIDYSYLSQALVKVVYLNRGKFEDDNSITERSLKAVSKINEAESQLIEKFCTANREGDAALSKPDCPLAKTQYEKALSLIPGEAYPAQQLAKVGKCLQDKEAADKKAQETATADAAKKDADKKAVEDAVAKAKADKAAKDQELNDKLAKAAEADAKKKAAATEKKNAKAPEAPKAAPADNPPPAAATTTVKPKNSIIKIKEKSEEDLEADKKRAGRSKSEAEDAEKIRLDAEKAQAKKAEKDKKYKEHLAKEQEEERQKAEERRQKEKEQAKKDAEEQAAKAEEQRKKREEQEAKDKEEAKKEAEERAVKAKEDQEARDKEEAERAAAEKEKRKKRYEKIEEDHNSGKSKSNYSIPAPLGSANTFKDKVKKADGLFNDKRYAEAKTTYEEALKLKPNDEYVTGKLSEISKLMSPEPPKQQ